MGYSSRSASSSGSDWEQWPEGALHDYNVIFESEDDFERWPDAALYERDTGPQPERWAQWPTGIPHEPPPSPESGVWEQWPEEVLLNARQYPESQLDLNQRLDEALHPALRSNFHIQQHWDHAPEEILLATTAIPLRVSSLSSPNARKEGLTAHYDEPRDERTRRRERRQRSMAPSPELSCHSDRQRRRPHARDTDDVELDRPTNEKRRHRHRRNRRHRSRSLHPAGQEPGDEGESSARRWYPRSRCEDGRLSGASQGDPEATAARRRHRRRDHEPRERREAFGLPSRLRNLFLG